MRLNLKLENRVSSVITIWERWNLDRAAYEHNHIANGFFEDQLIDGKVIEI